MTDFIKRREVLERRYLTATALQKKVFTKQAEHIGDILGATGVYLGHYGAAGGAKFKQEHIDNDNPENSWFDYCVLGKDKNGLIEAGNIRFSNIRKGGAPFMERDLPYETDRQAEEAVSMTVSNRGATDITREVKRDIEVTTRDVKIKEDKINWNINVGFSVEGGKTGTEITGGSHFLAKFEASAGLGGEHTFGSQAENANVITRGVADTLLIPAMTKYKMTGTFDKITMEQHYRIYYPIDFNIEISGFNIGNRGVYNNFYKDWWGDGRLKFDSISDLISCYLGVKRTDNDFSENITEFMKTENGRSSRVLGRLEQIADKNNRMIVQNGTITYNDASDISLDTWKLGTYDDKGELVL